MSFALSICIRSSTPVLRIIVSVIVMRAVDFLTLATVTAFIEARSEPRSVDQFVDELVRDNNIIMFSKTYCPFSKWAKRLLAESYAVENMMVLELDMQENMNEIQDYLKSKTGIRTVPQVFSYGKFVGGANVLDELDKKGKLANILKKTKSTSIRHV